MYKFRFFAFAAILACLFGLQVASAQTPANVTVLSGNGQIFCSCPFAGGLISGYYPLIVEVTDASNHPIAGATVNWNLFASIGGGFGNLVNATTTTAADGTTSNTFVPGGGATGTPSTPPTNFQVTASAGTITATFSLTQAYSASGGSGGISLNTNFLPQGTSSSTPITANSGQQGFSFGGLSGQTLKLGVITVGGTPVPGVGVQIINYQSSPTASCVTGPGANPGGVLTDNTGYAVCTPVFSGSGSGTFLLVVGGVPLCNCSQDPTNPNLVAGGLLNYYLNAPPPISMQITPAVPTSLSVVSGSGQSANAGQVVSGTLVAQVNAQGGTTLSGQTVNWSVSPAGAGTLANTTTVSGSNGQVSNTLTLSSSAVGTVTVTAVLASATNLTAKFTVTAIPLVSLGGLVKVSGDGQSAALSSQFANPLVVQVNSSTGAPVPDIPVSFSATGGATLSAMSVTTGSNGQAQVTVTAPGTAGSITVTASTAGFSQVFNLTVSPPGPVFTANSFVNAADFKVGSLSPCSLATIFASGIAPGIQGIVAANVFGLGPYPTTLANTTVTFGGTPAPILNVATISGAQQLTFQVPCGASAGSNQVTVVVSGGSATATVNVLPASPGVFQTSTQLTLSSGATLPLGIFVRPDGSYVTAANPARKGDSIIAYVTGMGPATPSVGTNAVPLPTAISTANTSPIVGVANAGVPIVSAQLSADLVGIYVVSFQVPSSAPSGNQVFSVGIPIGGQTYYSAGAAIPIQ